MIKHQVGDIAYLCFSNLQGQSNLRHFISTRNGGCSAGKFESLNLSIKLEPDSNCPIENRERLLQAVGLSIDTLTLGSQTHSSNVTIVQRGMEGSGARHFQTALPDTDALITSLPGITIAVLVADCVPLLLFDPVRHVIGAVHAGRMGTLAEISRKAVETMDRAFASDPANILVGIGPSICAKHYQVSAEAQQQIMESSSADHLMRMANGCAHFDLWGANVSQLILAGVDKKNIEVAELCTNEHSDIFFSERQDKKPTGRFCAGICMIA